MNLKHKLQSAELDHIRDTLTNGLALTGILDRCEAI